MRSCRRRLGPVRLARFEACEPRLVMSTNLGLDPEYFADPASSEIQLLSADAFDWTGLAEVQAEYGFTGTGQTVVVIDSGIAYTHTALGGGYGDGYRVVGGYDFAEGDDNPYDDGPLGAHGTHVAGIIASSDADYPGVAQGVDLVSLRVFDDAGHGEFAWVEEALQWVHEHLNSFANPITTVNLSLGSEWNSTELPVWASLEDELAQLEADGVFIAVAAGNSFTDYNEPGLSYPAASPYVVPVASADADGQLSYYSQRDARALAAPGRAIVSTVPDYLGNGNGMDDDFATFSGTSMATPYVAAASVLLRQAYQFVGVSDVNQDMLYDLMCSTADTIYDSLTGKTYLRLDIESAIDAIMPNDDFGSTADAAYQLGTVDDTQTFAGTIGSLNDRDYFCFTAGATGELTLSLSATDQLQGQWELVGSSGDVNTNGQSFTFQVVAGQSYTFALATAAGVGHYSVAMELNSTPTELDHSGGQQEIVDQSIDAAGKWFTLSAANTGIFTFEANFSKQAGDVDVELFDAQGNYLGGSYGTGSYERVDTTVTAGQTLYAHVFLNGAGSNSNVDLQITNLVYQTGSTVRVLGTDGDDVFQFIAGTTYQLNINGVEYRFNSGQVSTIQFDGFGGADSIVVEGTTAVETFRLGPGTVDVQGSGYKLAAVSVESVTARGGGGRDLAVLYDSAGDDVFEAGPEAATLSGEGFLIRVEGMATTRAVALAGGDDTAYLYDSPGSDTLLVMPGYSRLQGEQYTLVAKDFECVHAFSSAGGSDVATFNDSAGDDTFAGDPSLAQFWTGCSYVDATQFEKVVVSATAGGYDIATLQDSSGDDVFIGKPTVARLTGTNYAYCLKGFDAVQALASAGDDLAYLYDSPGNDTLVSGPEETRFSGEGFYLRAAGFDTVLAYALAGGVDQATLYGSTDDDTLVCSPGSSRISGENYLTRVRYFEQVYARPGDGEDRAYLYDSTIDDHLQAVADVVRVSNQDYAIWVYDLEQATATARAGGDDTADVGELDCALELVGKWR